MMASKVYTKRQPSSSVLYCCGGSLFRCGLHIGVSCPFHVVLHALHFSSIMELLGALHALRDVTLGFCGVLLEGF